MSRKELQRRLQEKEARVEQGPKCPESIMEADGAEQSGSWY